MLVYKYLTVTRVSRADAASKLTRMLLRISKLLSSLAIFLGFDLLLLKHAVALNPARVAFLHSFVVLTQVDKHASGLITRPRSLIIVSVSMHPSI